MRSAWIFLLVLLLAGCSASRVMEDRLTPQEREVIHTSIDDIARNDRAALAAKMPPELAAKLPGAFNQMHRTLPTPPLEVSLTNASWMSNGRDRELHAVYQVHGASGWALVEANVQTVRGKASLAGIVINRSPTDPRKLSPFNLARAGVPQWSMLLAMAAALGVTLAALVRIWRSGLFSHRWLWTIGAVLGLTTLRMNWVTGQLLFQPISFQLFSVSAVKQPVYAPWVLSVSLPLVALIALFWRPKRAAAD